MGVRRSHLSSRFVERVRMRQPLSLHLWVLAVCLTGCVVPGSRVGYLALRGTLAVEDGTPLDGETIEFFLPAAYGLGGLDRHFGEPEDYGHQDRRFSATTDERGEFMCDLGESVYHATMWFLPPLGMRPRRPPPLFLLVKVPRCGGEYYAVQTWDGEYKVFAPDGSELPRSEARLFALDATDAADESSDATTVGWLHLRLRREGEPRR